MGALLWIAGAALMALGWFITGSVVVAIKDRGGKSTPAYTAMLWIAVALIPMGALLWRAA